MPEIDFEKIAARGGSVENAFEELCCQLANKTKPAGARFDRYRGDGGDGGVECKIVESDSAATGWQAKFVFDIEKLLKQVQPSLETALLVHPDLRRYVICFPFDLTGKTARKGKSQTEKFDEWARKAEGYAKRKGRALSIERRSAHDLRGLLLANDGSGGIRHYFFSDTIFSDKWFTDHVSAAKHAAGPRYNKEINLETPLASWLLSFGESPNWRAALTKHSEACSKETSHLADVVERKEGDAMRPGWPNAAYKNGKGVVINSRHCVQGTDALAITPTEEGLLKLQASITQLLSDLRALDTELSAELDATYGEGSSDSKQFRSHMAEYMVSFPAANLDAVREAGEKWDAFANWLSSPVGFLAFKPLFVLSGSGGAGKTHGLCDIAERRLAAKAYSCILFGHQFNYEPDPWTRLAESLGVPLTLGRDGILDALNAAAEYSGQKLVICVDAVNETKPRSYWLGRLLEFSKAVTSRPRLKLCVSCRTSFLSACIPKDFATQAIEHEGFAGMEREACNAFFSYYNLEPPLVPILQPELANPLYLKLVCETLKAKGLKQLPKGWFGIAPVIRAFLAHKEDQFAAEHSVSSGAAIVGGSLRAVTAAIAKSGSTTILWSEAQLAIETAKPQAKAFNVLQWLVTADLLIEDGPLIDTIGAETVVRPAFERFGDLLVASDMLGSVTDSTVHQLFREGGRFAYLVNSIAVVQENSGLLSALSVLIPEKLPGTELSDLIDDASIQSEVATLVVRSLRWRTVETFTPPTQELLRKMLRTDAYEAMDAILALSTQESDIDSFWLHTIMGWIPLSKRDAFWCGYLKLGYEENNIVHRLIEAAKDIDLAKVDQATAERWCVLLLWFNAASDRRVKDAATRAAIAILRVHTTLLVRLVKLFLSTNDDEVRERALLVAYGALIHTRDKAVLGELAEELLTNYAACPEDFQNAIIRDDIRCIAELAAHLGCLKGGLDPTISNHRNPKTERPMPPTQEAVKDWKEEKNEGARLVIRSCLYDDFNHYAISCLFRWNYAMPKPDIGRWIVKHILEDFSYRESKCSGYDSTVTRITGGGRGKPAWAERIGKKYQWIAMYHLASHLYDSIEPEKDKSTRTTGRLSLILEEERKLDPTISLPVRPDREPSECWWVGGNVDLPATKNLNYSEWVVGREDLPSMESLLAINNRDGQRWLPLICYPSWDEYQENRPHGQPYRSTWIHLEAFLVPDDKFNSTIKALSRRNFFGRWMPTGAKWIYAFVGEYPWASACNVQTDDWLGFGTQVDRSKLEFVPVYNEVVCEHQYDGTMPTSIYFRVPARAFFKTGSLWWNGIDGFSNPEGKTIFRDPSASEGGPTTLLADLDDLLPRLEKLGCRLVWTLLGEKYVLGDTTNDTPRMTYSQIASLNKNGTVTIGDRVFFDDYEKDQGLAD
jgi:hypothetical protein